MAGTVCMQETPELQRTSSGPCKLNYSRTWTVGDRSEVSTRIQRSRSSSLFQYPPPSRPVVVEKHELAQSSKGIVLDLDRSAKRSQVKTAEVQEKKNLELHVEDHHDGREEERTVIDVSPNNYFMVTGKVKTRGVAAQSA
eukprot:254739_1